MSEIYNDRFFYGSPCKYGHDGLRYKNGKACVHCQRQRDKDNRLRHKQPQPQAASP